MRMEFFNHVFYITVCLALMWPISSRYASNSSKFSTPHKSKHQKQLYFLVIASGQLISLFFYFLFFDIFFIYVFLRKECPFAPNRCSPNEK